jgi:membrane associated rhomboid family serine protease
LAFWSRASGLVADHPNPANFLTALVTHAGWIHLIFSLWFLHLAGCALEKYWGTALFLGIFIACGIIGEFAFLIAFGRSEAAAGFALVGPTGSLAGLMGALAATHRNSQVTLFDFVFGASRGLRDFPIQRILAAWAILELLTALFLPGRGGPFALIATLTGGLTGLALGAILPGHRPKPLRKPQPNWST